MSVKFCPNCGTPLHSQITSCYKCDARGHHRKLLKWGMGSFFFAAVGVVLLRWLIGL